MSYILDALLKSQRERREGDVPSLGAPQLTAAPARGVRIRYLNFAAMLLAGAGILFGIHGLVGRGTDSNAPLESSPGRVAPQQTVTAATQKPEVAKASAAPAQRADAASEAPIETTAPARNEAQPGSASNMRARNGTETIAALRRPSSGDNPMAEIRRAASRRGRPVAASTARAPASVPAPPADERIPRSAEERMLRDLLSAENVAAVSPDTVRLVNELRTLVQREASDLQTARANAPAMARATPQPVAVTRPVAVPARETSVGQTSQTRDAAAQVRDLPPELRQGIGQLSINAHVYAAAPSERMIVINLKRYREGERLREGPRVDEITSTGAILNYESHRFRLNVR